MPRGQHSGAAASRSGDRRTGLVAVDVPTAEGVAERAREHHPRQPGDARAVRSGRGHGHAPQRGGHDGAAGLEADAARAGVLVGAVSLDDEPPASAAASSPPGSTRTCCARSRCLSAPAPSAGWRAAASPIVNARPGADFEAARVSGDDLDAAVDGRLPADGARPRSSARWPPTTSNPTTSPPRTCACWTACRRRPPRSCRTRWCSSRFAPTR